MPNARLATLDHYFGGNKISQSWHDLYIWEEILNQYPPARILELGTFTGGMSTYLHVQALLRGADFETYDVHHFDTIREERGDCRYLSSWKFPFQQLNVRGAQGIQVIGSKIQEPGRTILFCDNGDKEGEAVIYTSLIKEGDILAVHDWGTECNEVPGELHLVTPVEGIYEELESWTRFFIK